MDAMLANNRNTNKKSSIKDFLVKINNNNTNNRMPVVDPSGSNSMMAKIFQQPNHLSSQQYIPSLSSTLGSNQSVPVSSREMPCTILDEIRQLHQQKHQLEELKTEQLLGSNLSALRSQHLSQHQRQQQGETLVLESLQKQNAILWECMKRCECTIKNLEENQSKLTQANARLKVELQDQFKINKNLVQRNTDIVLDTSAKDQQIAVLKEQKKCLTKQNAKLKNFLQKADSYLDTLQSQQYLLQQRQQQMQQNVVADEGCGRSSASKKRKRGGQFTDQTMNGESPRDATKGNDTTELDDNDREVITVASTIDEADEMDNSNCKEDSHVSPAEGRPVAIRNPSCNNNTS